MKSWKKNSWRKYPVKHIPEYRDKKELDKVLDKIGTFPPLVFAGETRHLKSQLADVVDGKAFLLQGGDCAESFAEFNPDNINLSVKGNPLSHQKDWVNIKINGEMFKRETDTLDTFVDSSWYFLRFCSPDKKNYGFDNEEVNYWMPVDQYIGGVEHA